jgi:GAF domain-containing protein
MNAPAQTAVSGQLDSNWTSAEGLRAMTGLLERAESLDEHWPQLAARIAALFRADRCWIVLPTSNSDDGNTVRAYGNTAPPMQGTAGEGDAYRRMLARASAMLMPDPDDPPSGHHFDADSNTIFAPICFDDTVVGVVNVHGEKSPPFNDVHVETSRVIALLIGKALHLGRLKKVLNSRFAQLALMQNPAQCALQRTIRQPDAVARVMAKAFYREMARAGFSAPEITVAATEIISELADDLKSRRKKARAA